MCGDSQYLGPGSGGWGKSWARSHPLALQGPCVDAGGLEPLPARTLAAYEGGGRERERGCSPGPPQPIPNECDPGWYPSIRLQGIAPLAILRTSDCSATAASAMTPPKQDMQGRWKGSVQGRHPPQAQAPPGLKSSQCQNVTAVCRFSQGQAVCRRTGIGGQASQPL